MYAKWTVPPKELPAEEDEKSDSIKVEVIELEHFLLGPAHTIHLCKQCYNARRLRQGEEEVAA